MCAATFKSHTCFFLSRSANAHPTNFLPFVRESWSKMATVKFCTPRTNTPFNAAVHKRLGETHRQIEDITICMCVTCSGMCPCARTRNVTQMHMYVYEDARRESAHRTQNIHTIPWPSRRLAAQNLHSTLAHTFVSVFLSYM